MKRLAVSMAAALAAGLVVTAPAQAGCTPIHDPGSDCPVQFSMTMNELPGVQSLLKGRFRFGRAEISEIGGSHVTDTADDGLDASVWVRYQLISVTGAGKVFETPIGRASGAGVRTPVVWETPEGHRMEQFWARVCVGPGDAQCSQWYS